MNATGPILSSKKPPTHLGDIDAWLVMPEPLNDLLDEMIPEAGQSRVELLAKAVILLRYAFDVEREGKHLAVIDDDLNVERELVGIFPTDGN